MVGSGSGAAAGVRTVNELKFRNPKKLALAMAERVLKPGGSALIKVFQGAGFKELLQAARGKFSEVKLMKPLASRSRSPESYLLAMQYRLV